MTVLHTHFYIVVDTQRGCHTLKKTLIINPSQQCFQFLLNITFMHLALQLYTVLHRLTTQHISLLTYNYCKYNLYMLAITFHS